MTSGNAAEEELFVRIKTLDERVWEHRAPRLHIENWLGNLDQVPASLPAERLHALYLLSQFMFFGDFEVRQLLRALYRDLYQYPIAQEARRQLGDTRDVAAIAAAVAGRLSKTRFLGVGNPAESGVHLLYYFRQENAIPRNHFIESHEIFDRNIGTGNVMLAEPDVDRYVFIDDFCGSGTQAAHYSQQVVTEIRAIAKRDGLPVHVSYYCLCSRTKGLTAARSGTEFDAVESVIDLDDSFRALEPSARQFKNPPNGVTGAHARALCEKYGQRISPGGPLGYKDGQLLLGFHHNIPDNSLPIFWADGSAGSKWEPMFRRYQKIYGWA